MQQTDELISSFIITQKTDYNSGYCISWIAQTMMVTDWAHTEDSFITMVNY